MIMHTFTNQYGSLVEPVTHMRWTADLMDETSAQDAIIKFDYPKKEMAKDFSSTFEDLSDAVFYNNSSDPYPENEQPYLGNTNVNVNITNPTSIDVNRKVLIFITTKPLFNGFSLITANLDTRSRYVLVGAANPTGYNFNYMHPGDYYLNAIYDSNGDQNFTSGDYMNSNLDIPFTLSDKGNISTNVTIDFQIP